jgi:hypothetical protein
MAAAILGVMIGASRADDERLLEPPVRLVVKAIPIGKIAPDILEERRSGSITFVRPGKISMDLSHVIQLVKRGKRVALLVDGVASPKYDDPYRIPFCYQPVFSDDGRHYAFTAWHGKRIVVVLDGAEVQNYKDCYVDGLTFSPGNDRLAYFVRPYGQRYRSYLMIDGVSLDTYDGVSDPQFSRDGTHMVYKAWQENKTFIIKDGVPGKHYDSHIWLIRLSPNGQRVAYRVDRNDKKMVVVDKMEGPQYDDTSAPIFSPDGRHVAYLARRGSDIFQVVDASEGTPYPYEADALLNERIFFSQDSKHTAYLSETATCKRLIVDGVMQKEYPDSIGNDLLFSPDNKRLAIYGGKILHVIGLDFERTPSAHLVADDIVDTRASEPLCSHLRRMFLPNSRRPGYSLLEEHQIVVEGEDPSWLRRVNIGSPEWYLLAKFDYDWIHEYSHDRMAFLTVRKGELFRVEVEIVAEGGAGTSPVPRHR